MQERTEKAAKLMAAQGGDAPDPKAPAADAAASKDGAAAPAGQGKSDDKAVEVKPDGTPEERLAAAARAIETGDLKLLAKATGKDPKLVDVSAGKLAAARRAQQKADRKAAHADKRERDALEAERRNTEKFGDPLAIVTAWNKGEYHVMSQTLQRWCGDSFAKITQKIARATAGFSPEKLAELQRQDELERENKRLKDEQEKAKTSSKKTAERSEAVKVLATKCAGHEVMKLEDGAELVMRELEANFSNGGTRLSLKAAADNVVQRFAAAAAALGYVRAGTPAAAPAPAVKPPGTPPRGAKVETPDTPPPEAAAGQGRKSVTGKVLPSFAERNAKAERLAARRVV